MRSRAARSAPTLLTALLIVAVIFTAYTAQQAFADHQPADKVAIAGGDMDITSTEGPMVALAEQLRVSSPSDLLITFSAECRVGTRTSTGNDDPGGPDEQAEVSTADAWVYMWVEVDGRRLGVTPDDEDGDRVSLCQKNQSQWANESEEQQDPECQVARELEEQDVPIPGNDRCDDGLDGMKLYNSTRQSVGFTWVAINGGTFFDDLANGQNILDVVVKVEIVTECESEGKNSCAAWGEVDERSLVIEPVHASNHEQSTPDGTEASHK